ncbi:hypothetical protein HPP92_023243 [Vanilla planifolia]|uniref:Uncharacterized protein n=1 Tax=Vanilla planifolia TaxID=51239 RepID=A0A835PTR4_VANPL|nr:hypothetical protein HPP92_023243 [Vanilla planifolia]
MERGTIGMDRWTSYDDMFAAITLLQSTLLADCYRSPDPGKYGPIRNRSYMGAVRLILVYPPSLKFSDILRVCIKARKVQCSFF